jgi:hypothetical protein
VHYLKDGPFEGPVGDKEETIGVSFAKLAGRYGPLPGLTLKTAGLRNLNKAIDILEAGPKDGYFAFEDADFSTLKEVLVTLAENSNFARSAPYISDVLNSASTENPLEATEPYLGAVEGAANGARPKETAETAGAAKGA